MWVLCQATPRMFRTILIVKGWKFSPIPQSCHFLREKKWAAINTDLFLMEKNNLLTVIMIVVGKTKIDCILTAELSLTCRAVLFLLSWRSTGEQYVTSSWTPVTMSWPSSGPESRAVWLWEMPASGWKSLWESSSFVPWFLPYAFLDVSGAVPEWLWISGFMRKSSSRDNAPNMRFSVLPNSWDTFFVTPPAISSETWVM